MCFYDHCGSRRDTLCIYAQLIFFSFILNFYQIVFKVFESETQFSNFYFESAAHSYDDAVARVKRSGELIVVLNCLLKTLLYF